jgi:hypothetical protein
MRKFVYVVGISTLFAALGGCATPPPMVAQNKQYVANGQKLDFGGSYDVRGNNLALSVNGDVIMRGSFPPFTPTKTLNGSYKGMSIGASCYFGSVLSKKPGLVGIIAGAIQDKNSKSGDRCEMTVNSKAAETLYF